MFVLIWLYNIYTFVCAQVTGKGVFKYHKIIQAQFWLRDPGGGPEKTACVWKRFVFLGHRDTSPIQNRGEMPLRTTRAIRQKQNLTSLLNKLMREKRGMQERNGGTRHKQEEWNKRSAGEYSRLKLKALKTLSTNGFVTPVGIYY